MQRGEARGSLYAWICKLKADAVVGVEELDHKISGLPPACARHANY